MARPGRTVQKAELFKQVMSSFPTGVTIVTGVGSSGVPVGFTANAVASVSLNPCLVLVCADRDSASLPVLLESGTFGLSVLGEQDRDIAERFAEEQRDQRFQDLDLEPTQTGSPILGRALAWVSCTIWKSVEAGDHLILIGEVIDAGLGSEGRPLVFFRRGYSTVADPPRG